MNIFECFVVYADTCRTLAALSLTLLAAAGGQDDVLRLLIKKGVKVNARQKEWAPLP